MRPAGISDIPAMSNDQNTEAHLLSRIAALRQDFAQLLFLWHHRRDPGFGWIAAPDIHVELARAFVELGAPLVGLEVTTEGLEAFPENPGLQRLQGLALARGGSTREANELLERLRLEGHLDDETVGVLARTHKDLALNSDGTTRQHHLDKALHLYAEAYARSDSTWTGINVATLAALTGARDMSMNVALRVAEQCLANLTGLGSDDPQRYWLLASLGEAALTRGELDAAGKWYRQAAEFGRQRFGDLSSTRRQARLLLEHLDRDLGLLDQWLPLPRVVVFSGHMLDRPERAEPRFPAAAEPAVAAAIRNWLSQHNGLIGVSSAACGADLLFLEAIHDLGGETHVLLPYDHDEFVEDSVEFAGSGIWRERFDRQLAASRVVYASSSRPLDWGLAYEYANNLVHGMGLVRAGELGAEVRGLAVWNGQAGDGPGGAESAVRQWQQHGLEVHRVRIEMAGENPDIEVVPVSSQDCAPSLNEPPATRSRYVASVMSLLFADVVGFSRLTDAELAAFVPSCLGLIAELIDADPASIPVRETWGDGLFLAFADPGAAGMFALNLRDAMAKKDWQALGFSQPLMMRFALHAGPVQLTVDPVTRLPKCIGAHVARAARLEPKTPPGLVYASEAFAALAMLNPIRGFRCDYVKQLDWAKRYGTFPAYVVRRQ